MRDTDEKKATTRHEKLNKEVDENIFLFGKCIAIQDKPHQTRIQLSS